MFPLPFQPVLAIDANAIVGIIVLSISVVSWLINVVQGNNPDGKPRANKKQVPKEKTQSDLEKFLQDVLSGKSDADRKTQRPPTPPVPKQNTQRGSGEKKSKKNQQQQKRNAPSEESSSTRPGERLSKSHLQTSSLGEGVRSHIQGYMAPDQIGASVQKDIDSHVRQDIGTDQTAAGQRREDTVHPLALALRDPKSVRQAVLLTEILNKPKSLR